MTIDSAHLHDAKVEKPKIYEDFTVPTYKPVNDNGLTFSDVVMTFTDDGIIRMAQFGSDNYWHGEDDVVFENVTHWFEAYPLPCNFKLDETRYGGKI